MTGAFESDPFSRLLIALEPWLPHIVIVGGEFDRAKGRKATAQIAGIASQRLRFIELHLHQPWSVDFHSGGFRASIQIANPVSFIAQKVLIHKKRERVDKAKDILYMHDTLEVFGARLPALHELWRTTVAPKLQPASQRKVLTASRVLFWEVSDDIRRAAEISVERALSPEGIRAACHYGFAKVFGNA